MGIAWTRVATGSLLDRRGSDQPPKQETVDELDVNRYLVKWYAVAGIPQFFNTSCVWGNSAEYSLRKDGRIDVLNSCYKESGKKRR